MVLAGGTKQLQEVRFAVAQSTTNRATAVVRGRNPLGGFGGKASGGG